MKFKDMGQARQRWIEREVVQERFADLQASERSAFKRIARYVFVLNAGSAVATATQMIRDTNSASRLQIPMLCFVVGIIAATMHAAWDYYRCRKLFQKFRRSRQDFLANLVEWEVLVERDERRFEDDSLGHVLGWGSGLLFLFGFLYACWSLGLFSCHAATA